MVPDTSQEVNMVQFKKISGSFIWHLFELNHIIFYQIKPGLITFMITGLITFMITGLITFIIKITPSY